MIPYGLMGFTHRWARVLAAIEAGGDVIVQTGGGKLTRYQAKRSGALERLIEEYRIIVLAKPDWDAMKQQLGEAIYR